ncbi:MAG: DUF736 domain-containing protein [Sphingomonadales bacterium]|nr:DUF736 domain-containing protein [Sphingomonadales bacterium]MDE2569606.1 DUF736 domain-containing protein [Sphingomonadales bacterium]
MNIGILKQNDVGVFIGKIQTATLDLTIGLRPVNSRNVSAPRFDVMARAKNGQFIPVGGLWEKTASNGSGTFLQGQIDDPSFDAPLSIALFTQGDGTLNVAWSRQRRRTEPAFGDAGVPAGDDEGLSDPAGSFAVPASPFDAAEPGMAATTH